MELEGVLKDEIFEDLGVEICLIKCQFVGLWWSRLHDTAAHDSVPQTSNLRNDCSGASKRGR